MSAAVESLAIGWRLSSVSGWGVYALNLTLQLLDKGIAPCLLLPPHLLSVDDETAARLAPVLRRQEIMTEILEKGTVAAVNLDYPALFALRNDFQPALAEQLVRGSQNVGIIFFEDTALSEDALARARDYDLVVTGSAWNEAVLRDHQLTHVTTVLQGIDPTRFHPAPKRDAYPGRFVVYSGGKFEYRKAQDAVVAAFKIFNERHADALLIFNWANQWTQTLSEIETAGYVSGTPPVRSSGEIDFSKWLIGQGLPIEAFIDLGMPANHEMPNHLAAADLALFPNRCEPGTNLVAMEAMACGIPSILSANTGHLDLIHEDNCYVLHDQAPVVPVPSYRGTDGWGEPNIDEILASLEAAYEDRDGLRRHAEAGANTLATLNWADQIDALLAAIAAR